jgi:hypothetical protein
LYIFSIPRRLCHNPAIFKILGHKHIREVFKVSPTSQVLLSIDHLVIGEHPHGEAVFAYFALFVGWDGDFG